jgi:O-antigen/teichoic acid export membrane protein
MSTIRRQSIISSVIVYIGFALGALNIFLFAKSFEPAHFGLTTLFINIGAVMYYFANLGMQAYIFKFYPYYADNLRPENNDMMSWALLTGLIGFILVTVFGIANKQLVIQKFGEHSAELVTYYYWIFPFGLGLTFYLLLEAFSLHLNKVVLTTTLKEVMFRFLTTLLIVLSITGLLHSFDTFIKLYAFTYFPLVIVLAWRLKSQGHLYFPFQPSRVTKKFLRKIRTLALFNWGAGVVLNLSIAFGSIVIAAVVPNGLESAAVYAVAVYAGSIMQVPQRTLISSSIGPLSRAWKDKDYEKIKRIYRRSSINQLIFSVGIFVLILLNYTDGINNLGLKPVYLRGLPVFVFVGLMRIVDMGTGLNAQIIGTSIFWRFELLSGVFLLLLTLPMNYILTKSNGVTGPAMADLFTFALYNAVRYIFLLRKFGMQPFSIKSVYTLMLGALSWLVCYFLFHDQHAFVWLFVRSIVFLILFGGGVVALNLSEDVMPVWNTIRKRVGI